VNANKTLTMKKILLILTIILALTMSYYLYYLHSDKKIIKDFANEIVDDSIKLEDVLTKYIKHTQKEKKLTLYLLNFIKEEYKKNPGKIVVYTQEEAKRNKHDFQIELKNTEKLYYIKFNEDMTYPFLINKESEIIVLFILNKGEGGTLTNARSDE
jgi:hypothetical protein